MIIHVAIYRMMEYLDGEKGRKGLVSYRFAEWIKWHCLKRI